MGIPYTVVAAGSGVGGTEYQNHRLVTERGKVALLTMSGNVDDICLSSSIQVLPIGRTLVCIAVSATLADHLKGVGTPLPRVFASSLMSSRAGFSLELYEGCP